MASQIDPTTINVNQPPDAPALADKSQERADKQAIVNQLGTAKTEITALQVDVAAAETSIQSILTSQATQNGLINTARQEAAAAQSAADDAIADASAAQGTANTALSNAAAAQGAADVAQAAVDTATTNAAAAQLSAEAAGTAAATAQAAADSAQADVDALEPVVTALDSDVSALSSYQAERELLFDTHDPDDPGDQYPEGITSMATTLIGSWGQVSTIITTKRGANTVQLQILADGSSRTRHQSGENAWSAWSGSADVALDTTPYNLFYAEDSQAPPARPVTSRKVIWHADRDDVYVPGDMEEFDQLLTPGDGATLGVLLVPAAEYDLRNLGTNQLIPNAYGPDAFRGTTNQVEDADPDTSANGISMPQVEQWATNFIDLPDADWTVIMAVTPAAQDLTGSRFIFSNSGGTLGIQIRLHDGRFRLRIGGDLDLVNVTTGANPALEAGSEYVIAVIRRGNQVEIHSNVQPDATADISGIGDVPTGPMRISAIVESSHFYGNVRFIRAFLSALSEDAYTAQIAEVAAL